MATNTRDEVEEIAKALAKAESYEGMEYKLPGGFAVPIWITYISRAKILLTERQAFK